jgi:hypothetical protein
MVSSFNLEYEFASTDTVGFVYYPYITFPNSPILKLPVERPVKLRKIEVFPTQFVSGSTSVSVRSYLRYMSMMFYPVTVGDSLIPAAKGRVTNGDAAPAIIEASDYFRIGVNYGGGNIGVYSCDGMQITGLMIGEFCGSFGATSGIPVDIILRVNVYYE